jgi:hypothetical protein
MLGGESGVGVSGAVLQLTMIMPAMNISDPMA